MKGSFGTFYLVRCLVTFSVYVKQCFLFVESFPSEFQFLLVCKSLDLHTHDSSLFWDCVEITNWLNVVKKKKYPPGYTFNQWGRKRLCSRDDWDQKLRLSSYMTAYRGSSTQQSRSVSSALPSFCERPDGLGCSYSDMKSCT